MMVEDITIKVLLQAHILILEVNIDPIGFSSKRPSDPHKRKLASRFLLRELFSLI